MWYHMTPQSLRGNSKLVLRKIIDFDFDEFGLLKFQMHNWLAGHEYAFILRHYRAYLKCYPDKI